MIIMKNIPDSIFGYIDFPLNYCGFSNKNGFYNIFFIPIIIIIISLAQLTKNGDQESWRIIQEFSFQNQ